MKINLEAWYKYLVFLFIAITILKMFEGMRFLNFFAQAFIIISLIFGLVTKLKKRLTITTEQKQFIMLFLMFPIWAAITALWSAYPLVTLYKGIYFVIVIFSLWLVVLLWEKNISDKYLVLYLLANGLIIATALFSLLFNLPSNAWSIANAKGFAAFYQYQNALSESLLFTLVGIFMFWNKLSHKKNKVIFYSLLLLNLIFILLTYSRATLLSLITGSILFSLFLKYYKYATFLFVISITFIISFLVFPNFQKHTLAYLEKDSGSLLANRTILWYPTIEEIKKAPLVGHGYGVGEKNKFYPFEGPTQIDGRVYREKGNLFLAMLEETGIIGLILFLIPMVLLIRKHILSIHLHQSVLFLSYIFSIIIISQFENWNGGGHTFMHFFLLFCFFNVTYVNELPAAKSL